jgi:hypothetical protein
LNPRFDETSTARHEKWFFTTEGMEKTLMKKLTLIVYVMSVAFSLLFISGRSAQAQATRAMRETEDLDNSLVKAKVKHPQKIDAAPFLELLSKAQKMKESGELDLSHPIEMSITADRNPTGSLRNVKIEQKQGNAKAKQLVSELVTLMDRSRALDFLEGNKPLRLTLRLDKATVALNASTEAVSKKRATELARVYSLLIYAGALAKQGRDEELIYKNTTVNANGNQINIKLQMPRAKVGEILSKRLQSSL